MRSNRKWFKATLVNVQTLGARCGFGEGRTLEAAIEDGLRRARQIDPEAWTNGHHVFFRGGMNC